MAALEAVQDHMPLLVCMVNCSRMKAFQVPLTVMDVSEGGAQVRQTQSWHLN